MKSVQFTSGAGEHTAMIAPIAEHHWHALEDDLVVGRGEAFRRPDGRLFVSVDCWHDALFAPLATAMVAGLPRPLYTVVDEADVDLTSRWQQFGFTTRRREWECLVPTDPHLTGLGSAVPPSSVTILPVGAAQEGPLRELDRVIRDQVEAAVGWQEMPAEVLPRPAGDTLVDPSKYAAAVEHDQYVGLLRVAPIPRRPRIGLIAVRADRRRHGIGRALLAQVLGSLHRSGIRTASAEINESNDAAAALFSGIGAQRGSSNLELVLR